MRRSSSTFSLLLLTLISANLKSIAAGESDKPNIVFFLVDDLGWADIGCYGSRFYDTLHIDALAGEGVRFTDAYAPYRVLPNQMVKIKQRQDNPQFAAMVESVDESLGRIVAKHRVAYLRTCIFCPTARQAVLELGSDDGVKVWLNRSLIHQNNEDREVTPGEDKVDMALKQGWNHLLVKVTQGVGGGGVSPA